MLPAFASQSAVEAKADESGPKAEEEGGKKIDGDGVV